MIRILVPLFLFIFIFLGCEQDQDVTPLKSKVKTIKNDDGTSAIRVYYENDRVASIVLDNAPDDLVPFRIDGAIVDSIVWFYQDGQVDYGMSYKRSAEINSLLPIGGYFGYEYDGRHFTLPSTNKIYLMRDDQNLIIEKIDSLSNQIKREYRYDAGGLFIGINRPQSDTLVETLQYVNENVSRSSYEDIYTEYSGYNNTYNPYKSVNDLLGFPFFTGALHNSKNNCTVIRSNSGDKQLLKLKYDDHKRVVKMSTMFYMDKYFEYYD
jgi:hypothetical protein